MTDGYPQAPLYAGWQVAPTPDGGWRAFDTGIVAAVLALSGYSLYHADANGALADLPGRWIWDAHTETLRGELPPLEQDLVGSLVERVVARLQAAAQQTGNPANPLVADLMASQILLAPVSPLSEAAWQHLLPGKELDSATKSAVIDGLRELVGGAGERVMEVWAPVLSQVGVPVLDRLLQAIYKAGHDYSRLVPALQAVQDLWALERHNPAFAAPLVEFLLYFGQNESAGQILALFPATSLVEQRQQLASLRQTPLEAACRVSIVLISWNRAPLLDHALTILRQSLKWPDTEIVVGLNGCTDDSLAVLERHGIASALVSSENRGIDLYREVFSHAKGQVLLELDDDVVSLPTHLDALMYEALQSFPAYGAMSVLPHVRFPDGMIQPAQGVSYATDRQGGLEVHQGSMWGCCLAVRREDFLAGNGFYGATLSKRLGEEDQLMRKLYLRQRKFGYLDCSGLEILL